MLLQYCNITKQAIMKYLQGTTSPWKKLSPATLLTFHVWNPGTRTGCKRFKVDTTGCYALLCAVKYQVSSDNLLPTCYYSPFNVVVVSCLKSQMLTQLFLTYCIPVFFICFLPSRTMFYFNVSLALVCQSNFGN